MDNTISNLNYIKSLGGVLIKSEIGIGVFATMLTEKLHLFIKDIYKKRNGKLCYINRKDIFVPIPSDAIEEYEDWDCSYGIRSYTIQTRVKKEFIDKTKKEYEDKLQKGLL